MFLAFKASWTNGQDGGEHTCLDQDSNSTSRLMQERLQMLGPGPIAFRSPVLRREPHNFQDTIAVIIRLHSGGLGTALGSLCVI